jgi:hypothetical protein
MKTKTASLQLGKQGCNPVLNVKSPTITENSGVSLLVLTDIQYM